jgi:RNA polymerase sigma-70 factor (ECF subfamily)
MTAVPTPAAGSDEITSAWSLHAAPLRRFAARRLRDEEAAEDIVQEAYLRLIVEAGADRFPRQPGAWLYTVANHLIVSQARRAVTARQAAYRERPETIARETPESLYVSSESRADIVQAMARVNPRGLRGLVMSSIGYSGVEIASELGRKEPAARTLMHRARVAIRRELAKSPTVAA